MYSFTNHFSGPTLRQRIGMMNRQRSGFSAGAKYILWGSLMVVMALACRYKPADTEQKFVINRTLPFPLTNATRAKAAELEQADMPWFRQSMLLSGLSVMPDRWQSVRRRRSFNFPEILCLRDNRLCTKVPEGRQAIVFINGQKSTAQALSALAFEEIDDLLVYEKWDDANNADKFPEHYRVFVSTTHQTSSQSPLRKEWKRYLQANAISDYPLGKSSTFSMNKLLEATFFNNKLAFVKRTKDDHLQLYDEYKSDIELYINGLPVSPDKIEGVHIREVDKLYTGERSFEEWVDGPNRLHRFVLYIQTTPKRAKRDSTYYVFSPFYTGDF